MSKKPVREYFNDAELAVLTEIRDGVYLSKTLKDYENSTGIFKDSVDPAGLLFSKLLSFAIKNIYISRDYLKYTDIITEDGAFNLVLQKIDEFHIPIEQYPIVLSDAGIRGTLVLDKLSKYDFDLDKKISYDGLYSAYELAIQIRYEPAVIKNMHG